MQFRHTMINVYVYLFNFIFDTGILPEAWLIGNVIPIFKHKGCKLDPHNYRPITLLSCLGKIFTSILNDRLSSFVENFQILNENQAGFRQGYSTTHHIFSLCTLFELLNLKKEKNFIVYLLTLKKTFNFLHRNSLLIKLLINDINGKIFENHPKYV